MTPAIRPHGSHWASLNALGSTIHAEATCIQGMEVAQRRRGFQAAREMNDFIKGHDNAALQQQFLDKAQAQRKPIVEPDRVGDDLGWEAMVLVADWRGVHASASLAAAPHKALP